MEVCFNIGTFAKNSLSARLVTFYNIYNTFLHIACLFKFWDKSSFCLGQYQYLLLYK